LIDDALVELLMDRALALAERGGGGTAPNPMVGCVITTPYGRILGEGFHRQAGENHAEIEALAAVRAAGADPRGMVAVVTLEPCAHQGKTPPCVDALVAAGIGEVVFGVEDPHTGKGGAERLREAGIAVRGGFRARATRLLIEPWLHFVRTGRPLMHLKSAITLNGRLTRGAGGPRWITGEEARRAVHRLRRRHAAVVIGIGTALADDPLLTVRDWPGPRGLAEDADAGPWPRVQPLRVVLDSELRLPLGSRLATSVSEGPVLVLCAERADREREAALAVRGVEVERVDSGAGRLDLVAVTAALARRGVTGALVEPGPALAAGLIAAGLADRWTVFVAPVWEPSDDALPLVLADGTPVELEDPIWEFHGADASVSGRVRGSRGAASVR
jgi:diaminohydroxyphosphoribosylaminopyrimidine deaminase/5-amino-6-(5-phosphoribosylamino)uracil reductase